MEIVAIDIGGTHARFALADVADGKVSSLGREVVLKTADHAGLPSAWAAFATAAGRPLPRAASIAIAGPTEGETLHMTNNHWVIRPALIPTEMNLDTYCLINDFAAVGHAVSQLGPESFHRLCGPDRPLPDTGVISIVGPGTGLGVSMVVRSEGRAQVVPTEGGHIDFAPLDPVEDGILSRLRQRFQRVSVERIVTGPGLLNIYSALADMEGRPVAARDDTTLWQLALTGEDSLAVAALDRFFLILGAVAGDVALAQGGEALVIAGGLGLRLADHLPRSGFERRFLAKGRFEPRMANIPVKLITHPQPGLFGAAAAYAAMHG